MNPFNATWRLVIRFSDGTVVTVTSSTQRYTYYVYPYDSERKVLLVEFSYWYNATLNATYRVYALSRVPTMYLLTFPPYLGTNLSIHTLCSFSWYGYPWRSGTGLWVSPWGLEMMAGTEGCYVEESIAGRIFNLFYFFPYDKVEDILDRIGVRDRHTRYEIAATALWAAQLVREVKEASVDPYLCMRSARAILERYYGFSKWFSYPASFLVLPLCIHVKHVDKETLYRAILYAIKSVENYVEVFPEWRKVDEESWVEMCRRLENYTMKPVIPTYAHTLLAGAYALYELHLLRETFEKRISELLKEIGFQS